MVFVTFDFFFTTSSDREGKKIRLRGVRAEKWPVDTRRFTLFNDADSDLVVWLQNRVQECSFINNNSVYRRTESVKLSVSLNEYAT